MRLRVTRQALRDLGLDIKTCAGHDARDLVDRHPLIRTFVQLRSQSPIGQEPTKCIKSPVCWNLHHDRWRATTWHDEKHGVVWLLAAGWHETGSRDDAYAVIARRAKAKAIAPTADDYADLEPNPRAFLVQLRREAAALMEHAYAHPNEGHRRRLVDLLDVGVYVEVVVIADDTASDVYVAVQFPDRRPPGLPAEYVQYCVQALVPEAELHELRWDGTFPGRSGSPNEIVVRWLRPSVY